MVTEADVQAAAKLTAQMLNRMLDIIDQEEPEIPDNWKLIAACRDMDSEIFMPSQVSGEQTGWKSEPALAVCKTCKVQQLCLELSIHIGIWEGVWGGMSASERRKRFKRGRKTGRRAGLDLPRS